jgi:catechol 2,3-dioxygenase-like lactoylglutathione lyase family enzyme
MKTSQKEIGAITLFTDDLDASKTFYREVFDTPLVYEDENSAVFQFANTMINLLKSSEAPDLMHPAPVASSDAGSRCLFTVGVDNVDEECAELAEKNVTLLSGPIDRPWGIRTASFADPSGHVWEIAHDLPSDETD